MLSLTLCSNMFAAALFALLYFAVSSQALAQENNASESAAAQNGTRKTASEKMRHETGAVSEKDHPLTPIIHWAEKERAKIEKLEDYTAILTKQENIDGVIHEKQVAEIKVRHRPLSFYTKFRYPRKLNGQTAVYIEGKNDGKIIALGAGPERTFGMQKLPPEGIIAMRGNKYPITDLGLLKLVDRLIEVGRRDAAYGECEVKYIENVLVNQRQCTLIQVTHPIPRRNFIFHIARIYVDNENNLPIMYQSYGWPTKEDEVPSLIESYTYTDLKINVGLTDDDFRIVKETNPSPSRE